MNLPLAEDTKICS